MGLSYREAVEAPLLSVEEERAALHDWQERGDQRALELLLRSHARLVHAQAQRWSKNPTELEDLVAEGMIGLMRAADLFDLEQQVRFSTYAQWWVKTCVSTALARMKSIVNMPSRVFIDARMGRLDGSDTAALQAAQAHLSINAGIGEAGGLGLNDLPATGLTPEEHAEAQSSAARLRVVLTEALMQLDPTDREILERRKLAPEPESADDTAMWLGVSPDRVPLFERRALSRLRLRLERMGCTPAMLG
ncbi:sigma-70 family RNA polymerase sigma factor [Acidimangrovimonas sediminis]|uniref:sigma-70 family RNA polymerase sigma factor n=1 Tax=Acidimangrovimonas sediminis TaxID=2056283 RepID=UPI000C800005|nr:sigma-70 family RNA polymerase sigma factor [Acidimangrovimonas sediminis]